MNMAICQICKEPIWSFICPDCLARDIGRWIPRGLNGLFRNFSREFVRNFSGNMDMDELSCIHCRKVRVASICPFCYLAEVYRWLGERGSRLAGTIFRMLPLDGDWAIDRNSGIASVGELVPVSESETKQSDEGICECCEGYSEELALSDGRWICRECEPLEK